MRCIRCNHDSKYKERVDNQCPACKGKFAFEPKTGDRFTDQAFKNAIDRVSSGGSVKFTERNLFYEVDRLRKPNAGSWFAAIAWLVSAVFFIGVGVVGSGVLIVLGIVQLVLAASKIPAADHKHVQLSREQFGAAYARWKSVHGAPAGLFTSKMLPSGPRAEEPRAGELLTEDLREELSQYSFDRAVITDTSATADLLLANNFHFENNCAVLSVDGHPAHAFATVRQMLRNNPKIEVYALHDCTPEGCELAWTLRRDPDWFKDIGQVFDVALRPAQAKKMKASWMPGRRQVAEHPALTEDERRFLEAHTVELAAIRPEQLVKRLFRAMTLLPAASATAGGDGGASDGSVVWTTDAAASDGGGDAFG